MAISGVSSISGGGISSAFRSASLGAIGRAASITRAEAIPALAGREDTEKKDGPAARESSSEAPRALADPRRAESLLAERGAERGAERKQAAGKAEDELGALLGQKSAIEARQAQSKGERSAEVVSQLSQLKARDAEVRSHESAHMASGGRYVTGGASYTYQKGPDGGQYAVGGEVGIDTSPVPGKPEETVQKMRVIRAAALAPSEPSAADLAVAAAAAQTEASALAEIAQSRMEEAGKLAGAASAYDSQAKSDPAGGSPTREPLDMVA